MTDLELLVAGALVTFLAVAGAYVAIRRRANDAPVDSFKRSPDTEQLSAVVRPHVDMR